MPSTSRSRFLALVLVAGSFAAGPLAAQTLFLFDADEAQEVPPSGSAATGRCVARLNAVNTQLTVTCTHDVVDVTAAHIHNAVPGVNGGIVFPFATADSPFRGVWDLSASDVGELNAGNLYVNIHSMAFAGGEIRGQIGAPSDRAFAFALEGTQEVPPNASAATGVCDAVLDDAETELTTACSHDVADVTGAHIHNAPAGMNGGIVFPFASADSPLMETWALSPADVAELDDGNLYVNVHSMAFAGGEIRGQMFPAAEVIFGDAFETGDTSQWSP